jgi:hypothetical protein
MFSPSFDSLTSVSQSSGTATTARAAAAPLAASGAEDSQPSVPRFERRRTPRQSVIVVLSEEDEFSPDRLAVHVPVVGADVTVACVGEPANIGAWRDAASDVRILVAPAGTSRSELREFAISQVAGDIVTLFDSASLRQLQSPARA